MKPPDLKILFCFAASVWALAGTAGAGPRDALFVYGVYTCQTKNHMRFLIEEALKNAPRIKNLDVAHRQFRKLISDNICLSDTVQQGQDLSDLDQAFELVCKVFKALGWQPSNDKEERCEDTPVSDPPNKTRFLKRQSELLEFIRVHARDELSGDPMTLSTDGNTAEVVAEKAKEFWRSLNRGAKTLAVGVRTLDEYQELLRSQVREGRTYGVIYFIAHTGAEDGIRVDANFHPLSTFPDSLKSRLDRRARELLEFNSQAERGGTHLGGVSFVQGGKCRLDQVNADPASSPDSLLIRRELPCTETDLDSHLLLQLLEPGGTIVLGSCWTTDIAKGYRDMFQSAGKRVTVLAGPGKLGLEDGLKDFEGYFSEGVNGPFRRPKYMQIFRSEK